MLGIRKPRQLCMIILYACMAFVLLQSSRYLPIFVFCPFKSLRTQISNAITTPDQLPLINLTVLEDMNRTSTNGTTIVTTVPTTMVTTVVTKRILIYNSTSNSRPILTIDFSSNVGIGNRMFQYATLFGIAQRNNFTGMIPKYLTIRESFNLTLNILSDDIDEKSLIDFYDITISFYNNLTEKLPLKHLRLNGMFQSYLYFNHCRSDILSEFSFIPEIITQAKNILKNLLLEKNITWPSASIILIGLHVRRGTVLSRPHSTFGYKAAPIEYIKRAMEFYRRKYKNVHFVVSSDGLQWCRKNIIDKDVFFINGSNPSIDMAALTLCNHTITTVGTFGWWSAYLTQGDVVYYKDWPTVNSTLSKNVRHADLFLPNWVGL